MQISHPMGRAWHRELRSQSPDLIPHELPSRSELDTLLWDLPLEVVEFRDEADLYLAVLRVRSAATIAIAQTMASSLLVCCSDLSPEFATKRTAAMEECSALMSNTWQ